MICSHVHTTARHIKYIKHYNQTNLCLYSFQFHSSYNNLQLLYYVDSTYIKLNTIILCIVYVCIQNYFGIKYYLGVELALAYELVVFVFILFNLSDIEILI